MRTVIPYNEMLPSKDDRAWENPHSPLNEGLRKSRKVFRKGQQPRFKDCFGDDKKQILYKLMQPLDNLRSRLAYIKDYPPAQRDNLWPTLHHIRAFVRQNHPLLREYEKDWGPVYIRFERIEDALRKTYETFYERDAVDCLRCLLVKDKPQNTTLAEQLWHIGVRRYGPDKTRGSLCHFAPSRLRDLQGLSDDTEHRLVALLPDHWEDDTEAFEIALIRALGYWGSGVSLRIIADRLEQRKNHLTDHLSQASTYIDACVLLGGPDAARTLVNLIAINAPSIIERVVNGLKVLVEVDLNRRQTYEGCLEGMKVSQILIERLEAFGTPAVATGRLQYDLKLLLIKLQNLHNLPYQTQNAQAR